VQENFHKFHVHTTQVSCSRKWLYALEKSDLQSIVQSAAEFNVRNLPEIEHVLFMPVSGASFFVKKLAPETCQSERRERGFNMHLMKENINGEGG